MRVARLDMAPSWRVVLASDCAGAEYKDKIIADLNKHPNVKSVEDVGVPADDNTAYPHVAVKAAKMIAEGKADRGIFICGTGMGALLFFVCVC